MKCDQCSSEEAEEIPRSKKVKLEQSDDQEESDSTDQICCPYFISTVKPSTLLYHRLVNVISLGFSFDIYELYVCRSMLFSFWLINHNILSILWKINKELCHNILISMLLYKENSYAKIL